MNKSASKINYNFRASSKTKPKEIKAHIKALKGAQSYMFKGINVKLLRQDPEAVNILTAACETATIAVEANNNDRPFFLSVGENHNLAAHSIHHMLVINGLKRKNLPYEISIEQPEGNFSDDITLSMKKHFGKNYRQEETNQYLNNNNAALKMFCLHAETTTPYTRMVLKNYFTGLVEDGTSVKLSDAPHKAFGNRAPILNRADPLISSLIKEENMKGKTFLHRLGRTVKNSLPISVKDPVGMKIRNQYTLTKISGDNNIIHICGTFHIFDPYRRLGEETEGSLIAEAVKRGLNAKGRIFVPINDPFACSYYAQNNIYPAAQISDYRKRWPDWQKAGKTADDFINDPEEKTYVDTKLEILGLKHLANLSINKYAQRIKKELEKDVSNIMELHKPQEHTP